MTAGFNGSPPNPNVLDNPPWLRAMLWCIAKQSGGELVVDITPAFALAGQAVPADLGHIQFAYHDDMKHVTLRAAPGA